MISIRPEVQMYGAFARLNYKPWFALGEFVDNSVQSAMANLNRLRTVEGSEYSLVVSISIREDEIEISDNAGGIATEDYARAFLPAAPPPDTSGLSEFGLGMKAAASWFAERWSVRTTALGEGEERTLHFDIPEIVATGCGALEPVVKVVPTDVHYTTILLQGLRVRPRGRTLGKIRDHLRSMYRVFVRENQLSLWVDGEQITYEPPDFLRAPFHKDPHGDALTWKKDIEVDLGDGHAVRGWAGILARASVANAGFSIFRRGRLVEGSHGDGYRPESIFGSPNKFVYQRLIGELEVFGFSVSHTKDGIQWDDWEDDVLSFIREQLDSSPLPLLDQAANYRARAAVDHGDQAVARAVDDTIVQFVQHVSPVLDSQIAEPAEPIEVPQRLDESDGESVSREITLELIHARRLWTVKIELVADTSRENMYELAETDVVEVGTKIHIRINLDHPFVARFASPGGEELLLVTRLIAGLAVAEVTAREAGVKQAGSIRMNLNQILRSALSGPIQAGEKHVR